MGKKKVSAQVVTYENQEKAMSERIRIEKKSFERPPRPERVRPGRKSDKLSLLADATTKAGKGGNQRLRDVPRAAKNGGG